MTATHETLILGCEEGALPAGVPLEQALSEIAKLNAHAAHAYFVERHARGVDWNTAKASLTEKFGFTARQMSSITFPVDGKAKGILEGMKTRVEDLQGRIASAENQLKKWNTSLKNELSKDAKQRDWRVKREAAKLAGKKSPAKPKSLVKFSAHYSAELRTELRSKLFHKKRYIIHLRRVLAGLEAEIAANRVRLCFGGRRLFKQQYHLAENGFTSHEEWRRAWRDERTS